MPVYTKSGKISAKIAARMTVKRAMKIEKIVRLTNEGFKDDAIALMMGITITYVSMLRRTPEYLAIDAQVRTGVIARYDRHLLETIDAQQEELKEMLPESLNVLRTILFDRSNPRLRLEAAKEIMDREGSLAKVSKTEIKTRHEYDFDQHEKDIEADILSAMQSSNPVTDQDITDFVKSDLDAEGQEKLHAAIEATRLEDLKTSSSIN